MKLLDILRAKRADIEAKRAAALDALEAVATAAVTETRSLTTDEDATIAARTAEVVAADAELVDVDARIGELEAIEARTAEIAKRPALQVVRKPDPAAVMEDRAATPQQLADAVTRNLEGRHDNAENMAHVRSLVMRHRSDTEWARQILVRSSEPYESAFVKVIAGRHWDLTAEERTALSTVTAGNGGYLVPTHLDPTVMLTNSGTSNAVRAISRVVTLTRPGDTSWQGITSAGVTASFDAQLAEVSDDSPTFAQPSVDVHKAQAFVQASSEWVEDVPGAAGEVLAMFGDARDRLEGDMHCNGTGTNQPVGIFTALAAASPTVSIVSDTAAAIYKADLDEMYRSVPIRFRGRSRWLMNPIWNQAIQNLGTAVSATYTTNLTQEPSGVLLGKAVTESDDAPLAATTTVKDPEIIFGDFSNYVIVDKPGSFSIINIPVLFNTANNLPDGRTGWYAHWRSGADSVLDGAFRMLVDKTSA